MIFIEIRCDKCQTVGISRHCFYAHKLREELKAQGWKCIADGGKDYCPKCKPRPARSVARSHHADVARRSRATAERSRSRISDGARVLPPRHEAAEGLVELAHRAPHRGRDGSSGGVALAPSHVRLDARERGLGSPVDAPGSGRVARSQVGLDYRAIRSPGGGNDRPSRTRNDVTAVSRRIENPARHTGFEPVAFGSGDRGNPRCRPRGYGRGDT